MTKKECLYVNYREMIRHENDLINQRLTWLSGFQGLLFAALAFAWGKSNIFYLSVIICIVGFLIAVSIGLATSKANRAIKNLSQEWDEKKLENYDGPDIEGNRCGSEKLDILLPGSFVPLVFSVAWVFIFAIRVTIYS